MKALHMVTFILVLVGALNWGLTALGLNVVNMLLGSMPQLEQVVYLAVGASAIYVAVTHPKDCRICGKS
jgi:uncharacterized protein